MARRIDTQAVIDSIRLEDQVSDPSNTDAGYHSIFVKSDGLYVESPTGSVVGLNFTEWESYNTVWEGSSSNPSIGNGTLYSAWRRTGIKSVEFRIFLRIGSSTNEGNGTWTWTLPTVITGSAYTFDAGNAFALDAGTAWYNGACIIGYGDSNKVAVILGAQSLVGQGSPITWANDDLLVVRGSYVEP